LKNNLIRLISALVSTQRRIYFAGLAVTLGIAFKEVFARSTTNFQIFSFGSLDFWTGKNPYLNWDHVSLLGKQLDVFLYGPLFSVLFAPFAVLPMWLGPFCWNVFTYTLLFFSVLTLPAQFSFLKKRFILLYSSLVLFATLLSLQLNPVVAAIFLFSFTLFEKDKGFWAILLIMISGFIKIYGFFQLAMIFFYPRPIKKILYSILIFPVLLLLPVVNLQLQHLFDYYANWFSTLTGHLDGFRNYSIFRLTEFISGSAGSVSGIISVIVFLMLFVLSLFTLNTMRKSFAMRTMFLGILMGWVILFSTGSERHTYVIAVIGYALWYLTVIPAKTDKVLLWLNLILLGIVPIDIFCPVFISDFLLDKIFLNVIVFTITWGIMVYKTFFAAQPRELSKVS
jgi:hypothetical protein